MSTCVVGSYGFVYSPISGPGSPLPSKSSSPLSTEITALKNRLLAGVPYLQPSVVLKDGRTFQNRNIKHVPYLKEDRADAIARKIFELEKTPLPVRTNSQGEKLPVHLHCRDGWPRTIVSVPQQPSLPNNLYVVFKDKDGWYQWGTSKKVYLAYGVHQKQWCVFSKSDCTGWKDRKITEQEVSCLRELRKVQGVIETYDIFPYINKRRENTTAIVQPCYNCGDLFTFLIDRPPVVQFVHFSNVSIAKQLLEGLVHIHDHQIIHRDLKPENIFVDYTEKQLSAVIADFGLACKQRDLTNPNVIFGGTPEYYPPEIASTRVLSQKENAWVGAATQKWDVWSMGCILLGFLSDNALPWENNQDQDTRLSTIANLNDHWVEGFGRSFLTDSNRDFFAVIKEMLRVVPEQRITARQALDRLNKLDESF